MVAVGAAEHDAGTRIYHEDFSGGITVSSFMFDRRTLEAMSEERSR